MKKIVSAMLAVVLIASMFVGCGSVDSESSIVFIGKKGNVQTVDVEEFDESYFNETDFTTFAQEEIDTYNMSHEEDSITLTEFTVTEGVAKLKMEYKTLADYNNFNGVTVYQGTISDAVAEGYLFDVDFSSVEDGAMADAATRADILAEDGLSVVIVKANMDLKVDGTIRFVSTENVTVTAKDTVSIGQEEDTSLVSDVSTYIIYK